MFVREGLGISLRLIRHLGLCGLLRLGCLQRSDGLGRVSLGGLCGGSKSLGLLKRLDFCGFRSLNGLRCLRCLGRLCESGCLRGLCCLRNLSSLGLFCGDDGLRLLGRLRCLGR